MFSGFFIFYFFCLIEASFSLRDSTVRCTATTMSSIAFIEERNIFYYSEDTITSFVHRQYIIHHSLTHSALDVVSCMNLLNIVLCYVTTGNVDPFKRTLPEEASF